MDIRILGRLLLLHLFLSSTTAQEKSSDCGAKTKSDSYLDIAQEMIRNAKNTYSNCPSHSALTLDCEEELRKESKGSGVYTIWPKNRVLNGKPVEVFCDMETDGGGWTLIQRRGNFSRPKDYFFQDWQAYKNGFGDIEKDFWLGNDNIFALTNQKLYSVRFDLKDVEGNKSYALYDTFWIDDEDHKYTLHINGYSGDSGDSMTPSHVNQKFSTKDQDNDAEATVNCAQTYKGGWWYGGCHSSNLNGLYLHGKHDSYADGINWHSWKGHHESMDTTEIKIRPRYFKKQVNPVDSITPQ